MSALKKTFILIFLGTLGWLLSGSVFYVSELLFKQYLAILFHFVFAPFIFVGVSIIYFKYCACIKPIYTALVFTLIVILLDFLVLSLLVERNLRLFTNVMGTWIPFLFIFLATFLTGLHYTDQTLGK